MQKITLFCVGSLKTSWIADGCREYSSRLQSEIQFSIVEISASKQKDSKKQCEEESQSLLKRLEKFEGEKILLDEKGVSLTSKAFAQTLEVARDHGRPILFLLGGAYGVDEALRKQSDKIMSLSAMTLPHELCRLVFLEQLYRGTQILKGTGYHH